MNAKNAPLLAPVDVNQKYDIEEAMRYERCSRQTLYSEINAGRLKTIRVGRRRYVPGSELARRAQIPSV
jgi:hypothetical protein